MSHHTLRSPSLRHARYGTLATARGPSRIFTVASLVAGDVFAAALAGTIGVFAAVGLTGSSVHLEQLQLIGLSLALSPLAYAVARLYPGIGVSEVDELRLLTLSTTCLWFVLLPAIAITRGSAQLWAGVFAWAAALAVVPIVRAGVRRFASALPWWGVPVVVLGAGRAGTRLIERLKEYPQAGLCPVAAFDDDPDLLGRLVHDVPIAGTLGDSHLLASDGVRHALIAMPSLEPEKLTNIIRAHAASFPSLIVVPDIIGLASNGVTAFNLGGTVGLQVRQNLLVPRNLHLKRIIDLFLLLPAAFVALPVIVFAAVAIRLVSPGNPFYAQVREGVGGEKFKMWKLRTMYVDADERLARTLAKDEQARNEWFSSYKLSHDTRILPGIGRFLRKTSLDELPQLWNILRGEMSFVGPRPFPAYHLDAFPEAFRALRREARPGLTGLWQVTARSDSDLELQQKLDSLYISNWSPWMDIYLLARTPNAVLRGRGAR